MSDYETGLWAANLIFWAGLLGLVLLITRPLVLWYLKIGERTRLARRTCEAIERVAGRVANNDDAAASRG